MGLIRFLLAVAVVIEHAGGTKSLGYSILSGSTAVQCFYMVSGFLITMVLNEKASYGGILNFYASRYLRLWPAYIVIAIASLFLLKWSALTDQMASILSTPSAVFILFANATLFFQDWIMFLQHDGAGGLTFVEDFRKGSTPYLFNFLLVPQAWTLGVELTFYALAPFVMRKWQGAAFLFAVGLASRVLCALYFPHRDPWTYRFAPSEMMLFASGGLAYFAGRRIFRDRGQIGGAGWILTAFLACTILAWPFLRDSFNSLGGVYFQRHLTLTNGPLVVVFALAIAPIFYGTRSFAGRKARWDRWIGELSYPVYIAHYTYLHVLGDVWRGNPALTWILGVGGSIAVSIVLFVLVVQPAERWRQRFGAGSGLKPRPLAA